MELTNMLLDLGASQKKAPSKLIRNFNFKFQVPSIWADRYEELAKLHKALEDFQPSPGHRNVVVIHGMAGVGKSALAQYYGCWAYLQKRFVNYIWIDASSYSSMSKDFKKLMVSELLLAPLPDHVNGQIAAEAVYNSISNQPTLIVFDGARGGEGESSWLNGDGVQGFLPGSCASKEMVAPTVIVTSRNRGTWEDLNVKLLPLGVLKTESSASYIRQRLALAQVCFSEDQIQKMVDFSEGHPVLVVAFVREVLEKRSSLKCSELLSQEEQTFDVVVSNLCRSALKDLKYHPYGLISLAILKVCALSAPACSLDFIFEVLQLYPPIKELRSPKDKLLKGLATLLNLTLVHVVDRKVRIMAVLKKFLLDQLAVDSEENYGFLVSCLPFVLGSWSGKNLDEGVEYIEDLGKFIRKLKRSSEYSVLLKDVDVHKKRLNWKT